MLWLNFDYKLNISNVYMKTVENKLLLLIALFLGTWGAVFNITQTILIGLGLLYNIIKYKSDFIANLKASKKYIGISVFFLVYLAISTLFAINQEEYSAYKPRFGIFESVPSFFLLGSLYVLSLKSFITRRLLKQFLLVFCISVLTFAIYSVFQLSGMKLFTNPQTAIASLYEGRFGGTKMFLGGQVYLDAHGLQLYAAALISYFFFIIQSKRWHKILSLILFFVLVWFLSLTVTKSSILSFFCGFIVLNFYFLKKRKLSSRGVFVGLLLCVIIIPFCSIPNSFKERWNQTKNEIEDVRRGNLEGGSSITPRVVFYKSCFEHFNEYAIVGLGVYTNPVSKQWYLKSGNSTVAQLAHSHNSYLQYWMIGGIVGLCFILVWFIAPIYQMFRHKHVSFFILAMITAFFIDNNFEVLLIVSDSTPLIIFFLAMFYFYGEYFYTLERHLPPLDNGVKV